MYMCVRACVCLCVRVNACVCVCACACVFVCSGEYDGKVIAALSSCELRPPQSSCKMHPEDFIKIVSADTNCTVRVIYPLGPSTDPLGPTKDPLGPSTDLLGPPTAGVVESNSWVLGDIGEHR